MIAKIACTEATQNMVTPKWRRLYNNGRNFLLIRHNGPILRIMCNNKTARVELDLISSVSKVTCGLKIRVSPQKISRYVIQNPKISQSYNFFCLFHPTAWYDALMVENLCGLLPGDE